MGTEIRDSVNNQSATLATDPMPNNVFGKLKLELRIPFSRIRLQNENSEIME